ncbi:MAG: toll/interleukin-1 receptor domain-containing protein [Planctomycetia bacterium]|nr:toll/interleukin-1 receptor domain-containing protein [Planctomycetia bacterium]
MIAPLVPEPLRDLFLCHSKVDAEWVRNLAERVEREQWNGRLLRVAFDEWDVAPGDNVVTRIMELLEQSRHVAVVLSPEMLASEFCRFEWSMAVYDDPAGVRRRVMPILLRDVDRSGMNRIQIPPALKILSWLDFRKSSRASSEYQRLLALLRDEAMPRGRRRTPEAIADRIPARPIPSPSSAGADSVLESILSNVFPVTAYPETVWSAPTSLTREGDVLAAMEPAVRRAAPAFVLREQRIFTFADLTDVGGPFGPHVDPRGVRAEAVQAWRSQPARWRWYVELLNKALLCHARYDLHLRAEYEGSELLVHFPAEVDEAGQPRDRVRPFSGARRTVAKRCVRTDSSEFWIHHGCRLRFETLGEALYLQAIPSWVMSLDGLRAQRGPDVGAITAQWGGREKNAAILRNLLFWGQTLAAGKNEILVPTGGRPICIRPLPTVTQTTSGIAGDFVRIAALVATERDDLERAASIAAKGQQDDDDE